MRIKCWNSDDYETELDGKVFDTEKDMYPVNDIESAIERYCHLNFDRWEYPRYIEITAVEINDKNESIGTPKIYAVEVESIPNFIVSEKK